MRQVLLAPTFAGCMTLPKIFNITDVRFSHLQYENANTCLIVLLGRLIEDINANVSTAGHRAPSPQLQARSNYADE